MAKIQQGDFVHTAELLRDNIEAERCRAKEGGTSSSSSGSQSSSRREVPDILSWIQFFGIYACVVANAHPEKQQLLAYQTMLVQEARRCGGTGWQAYTIPCSGDRLQTIHMRTGRNITAPFIPTLSWLTRMGVEKHASTVSKQITQDQSVLLHQ